MFAISSLGFGRIYCEPGTKNRATARGVESMRRENECLNCGEVREMAAHGLCFKCYRRNDRANDRQFAGADRHNPGLRKEHKKLFRGFTGVMAGLSDLGVSKEDVLTIRRMLDPYVISIAEFLALAPDQDEIGGAVNSERQSSGVFTVHRTLTGDSEAGGES
jgi:hypothetical protein